MQMVSDSLAKKLGSLIARCEYEVAKANNDTEISRMLDDAELQAFLRHLRLLNLAPSVRFPTTADSKL